MLLNSKVEPTSEPMTLAPTSCFQRNSHLESLYYSNIVNIYFYYKYS